MIMFAALFPAALFAQKKESLAVVAFTGGNTMDGEAIASSLTRQATLRNAFNKTTLITQNTLAAMNFNQRFQRNSGLTDADSIFELGKQLNVSHVITGIITKWGDRNLVIVRIMDVENLQQIAGDYRTFKTIEEIDAHIPAIAKRLASAAPRDTDNLPGLFVPPFNISRNVNRNDAMVLTQILVCELANGSKYAVLPRTDSFEKVREEHLRQRNGAADQERVKRLGTGRSARYVLSGSLQRLGALNKFTADILDIFDGNFIDGHEESYTNFTQGFELMPRLAAHLASDPAAAMLHFNRGETFRNRNEWDSAIQEYTEAIWANPDYAEAYTNRGIAYRQQGDHDRAIADHNEALRINPKYATAYNNRGYAYMQKRDYDRAIADYTEAIRLNPKYALAYNYRGIVYNDGKRDYDRAIADYTQAIRINPNYAAAYSNRGHSYRLKGDYNRAITEYTEAIRINPKYAIAYNYRGRSYTLKGDYDRAIADYTEAILINPNYALAYNNRGNAYQQKGDKEKADADFARALELGYQP